MNKSTLEMLARLQKAGFTLDDSLALRRVAMTLHRWAEMECNGEIERDEETGKTYRCNPNHSYTDPHDPRAMWRTADREKGALVRLAKIMERYPAFVAYHQTDPRGNSLYIVRREDIPAGANLDSCYNRGIAVYR